jgi:1,4-dihydroxy-2-naphthoyl-CoA hydrolase
MHQADDMIGPTVFGRNVAVHAGRTTQVWDAEIRCEVSAKTIALLRCTQIILYSQKPNGLREGGSAEG